MMGCGQEDEKLYRGSVGGVITGIGRGQPELPQVLLGITLYMVTLNASFMADVHASILQSSNVISWVSENHACP